MKLISMTSFVLEQNEKLGNENFYAQTCFFRCLDYANFLKQPLQLSMFVPCDDEGNVLEEPVIYRGCDDPREYHYWNKYQQAKEKVLFDGFEIRTPEQHKIETLNGTSFLKEPSGFIIAQKKDWESEWEFYFESIESMLNDDDYEYLTLTPSALKQIGL